MEAERTDRGTAVELPIPLGDGDLFKHGASGPILDVLADSPDLQLSISQLADAASFSKPATREAVDVLEANGLVTTSRQGNARLTQINRRRLKTATDPVLSIPQDEFHLPVRIGQQLVKSELEDVLGIVLFGSVARGEADRQSDIDLWILVGDDPAQQQHRATKLATELSETRLPSTITTSDMLGDRFSDIGGDDKPILQSLADAVDEARPSTDTDYSVQHILDDQLGETGQRYAFEILVESPESLVGQLETVDPVMFTEGITLYDTQTLQELKAAVIGDE